MRQLKIVKQITNRESLSFNKYLTDVSNCGDVISAEEEIELTKLIKEGDMDARDKLIRANLRFVISVAKQYGNQMELPDLVSEGNIGLIKAAERFDETRGFKFISYAVWWVRQSIMQYISDNTRKIRIPLNKVAVLSKIKQASIELEQEFQRQPTPDEISEYLIDGEFHKSNGDPSKFDVKKIKELMSFAQPIASLDAPMTNESDAGVLSDILPGESEHDIQRLMQNTDLQTELERSLKTVSHREREVLISYFGIFGQPQISLEEIGEKFELTRERVRQIKEKGLRKLRNRTRNTRLKEYA